MKQRKRNEFIKLEPVKIEKKIYILKCQEDELDYDNLYLSKPPKMILENLDLDFTTNKKLYDSSTRVKIWLICAYDWGTVDWEWERVKSKIEVNVGTIVIHYHGGGFIGLSSASQ